ncbi:MAG TPA: folylpolyglutamate synthase/dihydrofolate synthase family protein [Candidatus Sulfotelmatobacter sp.]|nr:folylpolyglutamate synthase/dihydrofolate synthase family protein [Candidatus Sulfotelmatobacter sp.]
MALALTLKPLGSTVSAYSTAVERLEAASAPGMKPGLARISALLEALGRPHLGLRGALVGGTNGKGSVCAVVDAVCRAAGLRTALLVKPHLLSYCERVVIDGSAIGEVDFAGLVEEVIAAGASLSAEVGHPSQFELLTALGILAARRADAEVVVCEVGLGGRLDSTNVLDLGVAVITNVALDHVAILGGDVRSIAREKAGIIKPGNEVVSGASPPASPVVREAAERREAPLTEVSELTFSGRSRGLAGVELRVPWAGGVLDLESLLVGRFQLANVAVAAAACEALRRQGFPVDAEALVAGCRSARWPGRMQWIDQEPPLLLDGAHNPAAMEALAAEVPEICSGRRRVAIFAAMRDKDITPMLAQLRRFADSVIFTQVAGERALPATELAKDWRALGSEAVAIEGQTCETAVTPAAALQRARVLARPRGVVVVCGSLYLVGDVLAELA